MPSIAVAILFGVVAATIILALTRWRTRAGGFAMPSRGFYVLAYALILPVISATYWFVTR